jgi:4a-hydroxytetrahydrobiopterin dehydratase
MSLPVRLKDRHCVPRKADSRALNDGEIAKLLADLDGWTVDPPAAGLSSERRKPELRKRFEFRDFLAAMSFLNRVATVAEAEQHHPDFCVHYNRVDFSLWTHSVDGLSENDFILAAKLDALVS